MEKEVEKIVNVPIETIVYVDKVIEVQVEKIIEVEKIVNVPIETIVYVDRPT